MVRFNSTTIKVLDEFIPTHKAVRLYRTSTSDDGMFIHIDRPYLNLKFDEILSDVENRRSKLLRINYVIYVIILLLCLTLHSFNTIPSWVMLLTSPLIIYSALTQQTVINTKYSVVIKILLQTYTEQQHKS